MSDTSAQQASHPLPAGVRIIVTIGVMMAVLLQVLDTTIANVALPHMQASLSASQDSINWVLTSYIVASAIALPISGWLADRVGRKRLLLISVIGFTATSVMCATATSLTQMVLYRALQGVSGAFIVPLSQATLFDINPRNRHSQAMGCDLSNEIRKAAPRWHRRRGPNRGGGAKSQANPGDCQRVKCYPCLFGAAFDPLRV